MILAITVVALISIAINVWYALWDCAVRKNKHNVGEYVFVRTIGGPVLARIEKIMWESSVPPLIDGPIYYVFYVDTEKYVRIPESAIFCEFKGETVSRTEERAKNA